ncbi:MAG: acylphosphatase [Nitrosomonadales bacterium]|nr:acylphosphatase [Nitrosomonadales bacterium]
MKLTRHLRIYGLVQGVYFRDSLQQQAEALEASGWVRNRRDGSVEAMLQGEETAVESLIAWCRVGNGRAQVERVEVESGQGEFTGFERLDTV